MKEVHILSMVTGQDDLCDYKIRIKTKSKRSSIKGISFTRNIITYELRTTKELEGCWSKEDELLMTVIDDENGYQVIVPKKKSINNLDYAEADYFRVLLTYINKTSSYPIKLREITLGDTL